MSRTEHELLEDALEHLRILKVHLSRGDIADLTIADAVSLRLAAAIEAVHDQPGLGERLFEADWPSIWATRNRIAHGYATINMRLIRATVRQDLSQFESTLQIALSNLSQ